MLVRIVRPHQVDFLFHGPAGSQKIEFPKKKKKNLKKKEAYLIKCGQLVLPKFPFIMLHIIVMVSKVEFNDIHDLFYFIFGRPTDPYFLQQ